MLGCCQKKSMKQKVKQEALKLGISIENTSIVDLITQINAIKN